MIASVEATRLGCECICQGRPRIDPLAPATKRSWALNGRSAVTPHAFVRKQAPSPGTAA